MLRARWREGRARRGQVRWIASSSMAGVTTIILAGQHDCRCPVRRAGVQAKAPRHGFLTPFYVTFLRARPYRPLPHAEMNHYIPDAFTASLRASSIIASVLNGGACSERRVKVLHV